MNNSWLEIEKTNSFFYKRFEIIKKSELRWMINFNITFMKKKIISFLDRLEMSGSKKKSAYNRASTPFAS